jgi:hypothetical protein
VRALLEQLQEFVVSETGAFDLRAEKEWGDFAVEGDDEGWVT